MIPLQPVVVRDDGERPVAGFVDAAGRQDSVACPSSARHPARPAFGRIDAVTGLPNRYQFIEDFETVCAAADPRPAALVLVGLVEPGHYSTIVRALGHDWADEIIQSGACTMVGLTPSGRRVYHVSPLSFAFFHDAAAGIQLPQAVERVVRAFRGPINCRGIPVDTAVGVGVVDLAAGGVEPREALRAAMSAAQDSRGTRAGWALYDEQADLAHKRAFSLLADLRRAIESDDQLSLNFQPRIDFRDGRCVGAEALVRWTHPTMGPISPAEFIPLAEATALITPLTEWVLNAAARQAEGLGHAGYRLPVSVNVSPRNLAEPGFVDTLEAVLHRHALEPDRLELEFTEGTLASDQRTVRQHLDRISAMGMEIAIDDFGSGYSNMSYLTRIPARILKIDQAFVRPMMESEKNQHLVRTIVAMGHGLGYRVVAEGIETAEAFAMLAGWNCDEAQGYYISRPLPADRFADWLATHAAGPGVTALA